MNSVERTASAALFAAVVCIALVSAAAALPVAPAARSGGLVETVANSCIACQNRCLRTAEHARHRCLKWGGSPAACDDQFTERYGGCKVRCKGSPVCLH
jgi:hypothetical protein